MRPRRGRPAAGRINPGESAAGTPLRGVFAVGDAWRSTGDLFLRDEHHDLWLVDPVTALISTDHGPVMPAGAAWRSARSPRST